MGNFQSNNDEESNASPFEAAVCRNMSEYQLSLHDGKHEAVTDEVYISLNRNIFSVTGDEEFIEKHQSWIGKNTDDVPEGDVETYRAKYKYVGELIDTREFTVDELKEYDGLQGKGIYLAARSLVFDVTSGEDFYGPERAYHIFAGRNCQRALALVKVKQEEVDNTDLSDLDAENMKTLDDWIKKYHSKYVHVGYLKEDGVETRKDAKGEVVEGKDEPSEDGQKEDDAKEEDGKATAETKE